MSKYELGKDIAYDTEMNGALFIGSKNAEDLYKFTDHNMDIIQFLLKGQSIEEITNKLKASYDFEGETNVEEYVQSFISTLLEMGILCEKK